MKFYTDEDLINKKIRVEGLKNKFKLIIIFIILVLIVYNFSLIIQGIIVPNKIPSTFGYKTFTIISGSMEPTILTGDIVIVKEVSEDELNVGDIISYREHSSVVTHRISNIEEKDGVKQYTTKGDNNNIDDKTKITYDMIEGKVVKNIHNIGTFTIYLKDKVLILYIFIIFFFAFIRDKNLENRRNLRKQKKEIYLKNKEIDNKEKNSTK